MSTSALRSENDVVCRKNIGVGRVVVVVAVAIAVAAAVAAGAKVRVGVGAGAGVVVVVVPIAVAMNCYLFFIPKQDTIFFPSGRLLLDGVERCSFHGK